MNWDEESLRAAVAGLWGAGGAVETVDGVIELQVTPVLLGRWFGKAINGPLADSPAAGGRPAYAQRLAETLSQAEVDAVETLVRGQLLHQRVQWSSRTALLIGRTP